MTIQVEQLEQAAQLARSFGATRLILFGSAMQNLAAARDIDLACDGVHGWELYILGARLEEALQVPLDLIPLSPPNEFTRLIEKQGRQLL